MVGRRFQVFAVAVALGFTTVGCAEQGPNYPTGAHRPVLRLTELRGVLRPGEPASVVPTFTVYGDGTAVVLAPRGQGALPQLRQLRLPRERLQQLVDHAIGADVLDEREAGTEIGPDAPISLITLNAEGRTGTSELGPDVGGDLGELRETMREYAAKPEAAKPYQADRLAVLATPVEGDPVRTWPLGALGVDHTRMDRSYCVVYQNADARTVRQEAGDAVTSDIWYSGEATYVLSFRPLLPDEKDCESLSTRARQP